MLHCGESHFLDGGSFLPAGLEPCLAQAVNAHTLDILIQMPGCANAVLLPDMAAEHPHELAVHIGNVPLRRETDNVHTTELKKIPGIGSGIARLIIGYRQRLGGFYNITQLQEIHLDTTQLQSWFSIDTRAIHLINLNRSSIERLRNHPYINFYQAKAFVEYRKKKGDLHSLKPFALYEEFSDTDLEKISHYVCFE